MTDREKLIEWMSDIKNVCRNTDCKDCEKKGVYGDCQAHLITDYLISKGVTIPVRCGECIYNETGACNLSEFNNPQYDKNYYCRDGEKKDLNSSENLNSWKDRVMKTFLGRE